MNDRKPKALDDDVSSSVIEEPTDDHISCSSDSESDEGEKAEYAKCKHLLIL